MSNTWYIADNEWTHDELPQALNGGFVAPFPPIFWDVEFDDFVSPAVPDALPTAHHSVPTVNIVWLISSSGAESGAVPEEVHSGAFCNCPNLQTAHLPRSLKAIGEYAFRNTALTKVQISSDCTFHPTSFPDNCQIELFPDEESEE